LQVAAAIALVALVPFFGCGLWLSLVLAPRMQESTLGQIYKEAKNGQ